MKFCVIGVAQPDGSRRVEPTFDVAEVARAVSFMASLPPEANVLFMTVMATDMPYVGRGRAHRHLLGLVMGLGYLTNYPAVVLPIALASLVYGSRRLVNVGQAGHQKLDVGSVLLSIPAFGGVVYGLSQLGRGASGSEVALGFIAFGLVCMLIFGWRQLRALEIQDIHSKRGSAERDFSADFSKPDDADRAAV